MCVWSSSFALSSHAISKSPMNFVDTATSASCGQGRNQSIVQPLMRPGKFLARVENLSPTGEKHRHKCRLSRTRPMKKFHKLSCVSSSSGAAFFITGLKSFTSASTSSFGNKPATSPVIRSWLMYSKNDSSFTSASVKINATLFPLSPAFTYNALMSSNKFVWLYVFVIWIWNGNAPAMYAASRVSDCFPLPQTPMRSALPRSMHSSREMRIMCFNASSNKTSSSFMDLLVSLNIACFFIATSVRCARFGVDS